MNKTIKIGQVNISAVNGTVYLTVPFSVTNNVVYRSVGGRFQTASWVFTDTPAVRKMLDDLFAIDLEGPN